MDEMDPQDPFGWIVEGCRISSSEDHRLNRCSYFGKSDSDSSDTGGGTDGGNVVVDAEADGTDSRRAFDLGRGKELGFSEMGVDSARRVQADGTSRRVLEETRVSPSESLSKKLSGLGFESPSKHLGGRNPKESLKSSSDGKLKHSNCSGMEEKRERRRELPSWANNENVEKEVKVQDGTSEMETIHLDVKEITLMDILKILAEEEEDDSEEDMSVESLNLFELAERKWGK